MTDNRDLHLLLLAFRDPAIDPVRLAEAAAGWSPNPSDAGLMTYLVGRGVLSTDDLRRLENGSTEPSPGGPSPSPSLDATASVAAAPGGDAGAPNPSVETTDHRPASGETTEPPRLGDTLDFGTAPPEMPEGVRGAVGGSGRYRVLRLHQTGGLGQVWLARDTAVGREVALKTLRPDRANTASTRERFVREARVTGRLEHPSIVPLYDLDSDGDDPFYVMRFVSGRTLAEASADYHRRLAEGRVGPLDLTPCSTPSSASAGPSPSPTPAPSCTATSRARTSSSASSARSSCSTGAWPRNSARRTARTATAGAGPPRPPTSPPSARSSAPPPTWPPRWPAAARPPGPPTSTAWARSSTSC